MPKSASYACRRFGVMVVLATTGLLFACSPDSPADAPVAVQDSVPKTPEEVMVAVQAAISEQNLGDAAAKAKAAQAQFPANPRIHLLAAEVEGQLGNAGNSVAAFRRALDSGLEEPIMALRAPAFDQVRDSETFRQLQTELAPAKLTTAPRAERSTTERVRAGDVEITTDATGDYVRAGDIVLDTRP